MPVKNDTPKWIRELEEYLKERDAPAIKIDKTTLPVKIDWSKFIMEDKNNG